MTYNPSDVGKKGSIFGLPYTKEEATLLLLPVHLDVTVSYRDGTSKAPDTILEESSQLDLSLLSIREPWQMKVAMTERIIEGDENDKIRNLAASVIEKLELGENPNLTDVRKVNGFCENVCDKVYQQARNYLDAGKYLGLIGGDHSSPLGSIRALAEEREFGILQVDAHMDLRKAYEGFTYSHASIMYNALREAGVTSLTQVGIRDFCDEEELRVKNSDKPIHVFYDEQIYREVQEGKSWALLAKEIVDTLPRHVYISFDMDGLIPTLCPNTGTPVPGGLEFNQTNYLLEQVVRSGRKIIGFDVCECGNNPWDANVAARIIFRIATLLGISQGLLSFR